MNPVIEEPKFISLSEARHDLNLIPKRFETNPLPVLVEHQGKPTFAIIPIELYAAMEGAMDFIEEEGLSSKFETWLDEVGQELDKTKSETQ